MRRMVSLNMCCVVMILVAAIASGSNGDEPIAGHSATTQNAQESKLDSLTAKQVLDRMGKTYAACKSYQDSGVVKTVFITADGGWTDEKPFATAFIRPDKFRFEYRSKMGPVFGNLPGNMQEHRYIIWCSGKQVKTWWDVKPGVEKSRSLPMALGGATGVSGGSANTIPALLLPDDIKSIRLTDLKQAKRIEDADIKGVACFRIQGKRVDSPTTVWIDKRSFLVRRIDSQHQFDNFQTEESATYDPLINIEVSDEALEFNAPKQD